ncbi:MAG: tail fiber protein, partial [Leptospirales bacterium]
MTAEEYAGSICLFGGHFAPDGYLMCDGTMIAIAQDTLLYSILGDAFGGDGRTTFGLPDFRGRFAMQEGQGIGLSNRIRGQRLGNEPYQFTLRSETMAQHTHAGQFSADALNPTVMTNAD